MAAPPRIVLLAIVVATSCVGPTQSGPGAREAPPAAPPLAVAPPAPAPAPRPWSDDILYFVLVDRFVDGDPANNVEVDRSAKGAFHGGDLKGLVQHLDEIADLGVTALWINPLVKNTDGFVTGAGFPDYAYHGYWADDFTRLDPRFGTEQDLKALVDACHARGIKVLLDVVYNHAGYNSHYTTDSKTKDWFRTSERGTCGEDDLTRCVSGLPDFKTELPEVAKFLLDAQLGWAKKSGVDGFRLDTVKHVDHPFWKEHRLRLREEVSPRFFLLGEVWGGDPDVLRPWFEGDELDAGFDFAFQGNTLAYLLGRGRTAAYDHYLKSRSKTLPGHHVAHFLSSHDVPGALFQLGGDVALFRLAAVLQLTTVGIPTVYYGEEVARAGGDWPENRSDMPWGDRKLLPGSGAKRDEALRAEYKKLIAIRRAHPALSRGTHLGLSTTGDLYAFVRRDPETHDAVVVAINRGKEPASFELAPPEEWAGAEAKDVLSGAPLVRSGDKIQVQVGPKQARILAAK